MGVWFEAVDAGADLSRFDVFIVGKGALTLDGPAPDVRRVREGLKVLVFEQTGEVLEKRLGFRVAEYGLRQVFKRVPDHPAVANLRPEHLRQGLPFPGRRSRGGGQDRLHRQRGDGE